MAVTASTWQPLRGDKRWAYLSRAKTIRIATANEDGSIYLSPLWLVVHDKKIYIPIDAASRHAANFTAGRALSALVDQGEEYATVSGVRISGTMRKVEDEALVETLAQLVFDKYFHVGHPYAEQYLEFGQVAGRTYYELVPDKMIGWDMREINVIAMPEARVLPAHVGDRIL
ncbi:pyridoxamine 5'-phosphate oxidase family protein [Pseudonocardia halophobica]|uniref:pyridoxamine 5'-phosphate oxidase family protein n=1 Tax=Pseudonocardia halophobica TaxID=29401 RepID=UPI003D8D5F90